MGIINFTELLIQNFINSSLFLKINLLLLLLFFILILYSLLKDILFFLFIKHYLKRRLADKEAKLINLKKNYLDGKINAREYKVNTIRILNSLN